MFPGDLRGILVSFVQSVIGLTTFKKKAHVYNGEKDIFGGYITYI